VAPLVVIGWLQRAQISWIHRPGWADASAMLVSLAGGPLALAVVIWAVLAFGGVRALAPARGRVTPAGRRLVLLALPWLVLPPAVMLAVSLVKPVYNVRYVVFCIPALALLAGLGLAALGPAWRVCAAILILAFTVPARLGMRAAPGMGMREAASFVSAREQPGDAIVYPGIGIPPWYLAYPNGFGRLRDIGMARSPAASGRLYGMSVPVSVLKRREQKVRRIWVVQMGRWQSPAGYIGAGFELVQTWQLDGGYLRIWLYGSGCTAGSPRHSAPHRHLLSPQTVRSVHAARLGPLPRGSDFWAVRKRLSAAVRSTPSRDALALGNLVSRPWVAGHFRAGPMRHGPQGPHASCVNRHPGVRRAGRRSGYSRAVSPGRRSQRNP
jgi:hypothetical protein